MSTSNLPLSNASTTSLDPSLTWPNVRITSSTSIQTIVSSSLHHLSNPSSAPLILHTLPSPSNSTSTSDSIAIIPKNSHAGLCKLVSIVEIVKREYEQHQKEAWRVEDEKMRKLELKKIKEAKKSGAGGGDKKGKKRAREDEEENDTVPEEQTQVAQVESLQDNAGKEGEGQAGTSKTAKKSIKEKKKERPLLRVYQYNILDAYERLPGATSSSNNGGAAEEEDEDDGPSESEDDEDEEQESSKIGADLVKSKLKAVKSLDEAIQQHVIRAKKRPRKRHTPYMKIILSSRKLPEYEHYLKSLSTPSTSSSTNGRIPKDYTIQLPSASSKNKRSRTSKNKRGKSKAGPEEKEEGEVAEKDGTGEVAQQVQAQAAEDTATPAGTSDGSKDPVPASAFGAETAATLEGPSTQANNSSSSSTKRKSKKRKVDEIDTQSTEATQKSSQL